jgi:hypothetical protein
MPRGARPDVRDGEVRERVRAVVPRVCDEPVPGDPGRDEGEAEDRAPREPPFTGPKTTELVGFLISKERWPN